MKARTVLTLTILAVLTVVVLGASFVLSDSPWREWLSNAAASTGAALLVFSPLYFLQRHLDERFTEVQQESDREIEGIRTNVENLREEVRASLADAAAAAQERVSREQDQFREGVSGLRQEISYGELRDILRFSLRMGLISSAAHLRPRVQAWTTHGPHLTFALIEEWSNEDGDGSDEHIEINIVTGADTLVGQVDWKSGEDAQDVFAEVLRLLVKQEGPHAQVDLEDVFHRLAVLLELAFGDTIYRPLVQLHPQWVITERGLVAYGEAAGLQPYEVVHWRFDDEDFVRHVASKQWVDADCFYVALSDAKEILRHGGLAGTNSLV